MLRKRLPIVLAVLLLLSGYSVIVADTEQASESQTETVKTESEISSASPEMVGTVNDLELYYDEKAVEIMVKNKKTGSILSSSAAGNGMAYSNDYVTAVVGSLFSVSYTTEEFAGISESYLLNMAYTVNSKKINNGIRLAFAFPELSFGFSMEVRLADNHLELSLPQDSLWEKGDFYICSISPMPFLAAGKDTDDGYVFYPDGCGSLYHFKNSPIGKAASNTWSVYAPDQSSLSGSMVNAERDWSKCTLPVFGIKRGDNAYLGVITQGEADSSITLSPSGKLVNLSRIGCNFLYRTNTVYLTEKGEEVVSVNKVSTKEDHAVRYYLLWEDDANYSTMAGVYRSYLLEKGQLNDAVQTNNIPLSINLFMGIQKKEMLFNTFIPMTTFLEAKTILQSLYDAGASAVDINLIGWSMGGYGKYASHMPADSSLGGNTGLISLSQTAARLGYQLYAQENYIDVVKDDLPSGFSLRRDAVYLQNGSLLTDTAQNHYLASPRYILNTLLPSCIKKYAKIPSLGINLERIGTTVYKSAGTKIVSKADAVQMWQETLSGLGKAVDAVAVSEGNAYTFGYTNRLYDIPESDSGFLFTDESIPFMQIVLHGYIPYSSQPGNLTYDFNIEKLKWVEYGCIPHFEITSKKSSLLNKTEYSFLFTSRYQDWDDKILAVNDEFNKRLSMVWNQEMLLHEKVSDQLYKITYADQTRVYVNYAEASAVSDGYKISAKDYLVVSPEGVIS